MKIYHLIILLFSSLILACNEDPEDKILHEAHEVHLEAYKIKQAVKPKMEELIQRRNSIQIQGRALTEEEIRFSEKVDHLSQKLMIWEENHLEVPGFDHEGHDHNGHDHHHDHSHGTTFNLPASDILILQKEFRDSIVVIQQKVKGLLGS